MRNKLIALVVSTLVTVAAQACDNWDGTDTTLATIALAATLADWRQTQEIAKDNGRRWVEMNPLIGGRRHGRGYIPEMRDVNRHFVTSIVAGALVACVLPTEYRRVYLGGIAAIELGMVINNHSKGIQIKLKF